MIQIFNFKNKEPEKVPAWQYACTYILISIILGIIIKATCSFFEINKEFTPKTTALSALVVAYMFVYKYKRIMTKSERQRVTWYTIALIYAALALFFAAAYEEASEIGIGVLLAFSAILTLVLYFILFLAYGWFSKVVLKQIEKATEKNRK